ncbi:hypothetical protein M441DRAFT_396655 [Trichoderma asperellum CBS 433.97]|uniref:Uncharacterized protein n=1 Tax=Trichoderma asperellum (strain ATCC 204424 / CBS 433.97 / NBRC 101777) TaxID=1042311 RepID=A0A2T3Z956_TRIA4|nr:hypothetical protein M441DRAFT_396655 [Trichoderma asperellum CBS 433.97]PTB41337.1 hypothetical protein M441DRAFT_396655 [Trichoderma asperellum CBS 433.97]
MRAPGYYAFRACEKRRLVDDVLRHRLESGKVPGRVFRLVGTAARGAIMRGGTCAVLANAQRQMLQSRYLSGTDVDAAGRFDQEQALGAMPVPDKALVRHCRSISQLKNRQSNHGQIVCKEWIRRPVLEQRRGGCAARALPASLKRGRDGTPDGTNPHLRMRRHHRCHRRFSALSLQPSRGADPIRPSHEAPRLRLRRTEESGLCPEALSRGLLRTLCAL